MEVFSSTDADFYMIRAVFQATELQGQDIRSWQSWSGHQVRDTGTPVEILVKQINLFNYDPNLRNPSIII